MKIASCQGTSLARLAPARPRCPTRRRFVPHRSCRLPPGPRGLLRRRSRVPHHPRPRRVQPRSGTRPHGRLAVDGHHALVSRAFAAPLKRFSHAWAPQPPRDAARPSQAKYWPHTSHVDASHVCSPVRCPRINSQSSRDRVSGSRPRKRPSNIPGDHAKRTRQCWHNSLKTCWAPLTPSSSQSNITVALPPANRRAQRATFSTCAFVIVFEHKPTAGTPIVSKAMTSFGPSTIRIPISASLSRNPSSLNRDLCWPNNSSPR